MSQESKAAARAFYEAMNSRNLDAILAMFADDARTWVLGDGPFAGFHPVSRELLSGFLDAFEVRFTILDMISEGDKVALEIESEGSLAGKPYSNRYHNLITLREGKVVELKEYFDTAKAGG